MWLEIGKTLFELFSKTRDFKKEERERISQIFKDVSDLLQETSRDLAKGEYPHNKCSAMQALSFGLIQEISKKKILEEEKLKELENMLVESSNLEKEFANRNNPDTIINLSITSGKFYALSLFLKI